MMWKVVVALLAVGIGASSAALLSNNYPGCFPKFTDARPRPDCATEEMETWTYWSTMNYKYFAKKLTFSEAFKACDPWDEAVCDNEWPDLGNWRSHPVSTTLKGEIENAVLPAYRKACIKNGNRFWTGGSYIKGDNLVFTDGSSTKSFGFDPWLTKGVDCVAFNVDTSSLELVRCSERLPFMCRISPVNSH